MNCESLMEIKGMNLIAGKGGLTRKIRWIYFADAISNLDLDFNVDEWARGEELIVLMNRQLLADEKRARDFMCRAAEIRAAGLIVNVSQSTPLLKSLADELNIPLFELSYGLHLVDLSQYLCKILIQEEQKESSLDQLLHTILFESVLDSGEIIRQGNYYGLDLTQGHRMAIFEISADNEESSQKEYILYKEELLYMVKRGLRMAGIDPCMIREQGNSILALLPARMPQEEIRRLGEKTIKEFQGNCRMPVCIGVGRPYHDPADWKISYEEAREALTVARIRKNIAGVEFYNNTNLYSIIMHVQSEKYLESYQNRYLKPLMEADAISESQLLETLRVYLECGGNANAAAEVLFIHRNTMRYRLEKIRSILHVNLSDLDVCFQLNMALCIKQYLDYRNREKLRSGKTGTGGKQK